MAEEEGVTLDREGFEADDGRRAREGEGVVEVRSRRRMPRRSPRSRRRSAAWSSSDTTSTRTSTSTVKAIVVDGEERDALHHGSEGDVVLTPTPFYAESGGQIGDTGTLEWDGGRATVLDTQKPFGELPVSRVRVDEGSLALERDGPRVGARAAASRHDRESHRHASSAQGAQGHPRADGAAGRLARRAGPAALRLHAITSRSPTSRSRRSRTR